MLRHLRQSLQLAIKSTTKSQHVLIPLTFVSQHYYATEPNKNEGAQQNSNEQEDQQQHRPQQNKSSKKASVPTLRNPFDSIADKNKSTYLAMVEIFDGRDVRRRNHVEFINAALKNMAEFGVERDLEVYKALINVMPKGKFIPTNLFQAEFMHYPKQQQCIIDLLEQMEDFGVIPDYEMEDMLLNIFGRKGHPLRKYWRMMYWMPKFKNLSPWPLPNPMPDITLEIAKMAVERMCTVDLRSQVNVYETKDVKDALDDTWIVSGISPEQSQLLREHPIEKPLYIEGPFLIWLRNRSIHYFTLRGDPDREYLDTCEPKSADDNDDVCHLKVPLFGSAPKSSNQVSKCRSVHQQDDGTIFAICATGTSTKDSLLSWIRVLESNGNPSLRKMTVLFKFNSVVKSTVHIGNNTDESNAPNAPVTSRKEEESEPDR